MKDNETNPPTTRPLDLSRGIGPAMLGLIQDRTTAGGWLSFPLRADADELSPPRVTDTGCILTREAVDQCARAQGVRLAGADVDAVLALSGLILNSLAGEAVARFIGALAHPERDGGATRAVVDAVATLAREWLDATAPLRGAAAALERAAPEERERYEALHAWRATRSGSALASALVNLPAARAALYASQTRDEATAEEVLAILDRWAEIVRADDAAADAAREEGDQ